MLYSIIKYSLFVVILLSSLASSHVFRMGECPEVEPMPDFQMDRFLGEWYIIQKFRSASDCVRENFTKVDDHYYVKRNSRPFGAPFATTVTAEVYLNKRENETQGELEINYPLSSTGVINLKQYVVIATDYESYALVWNCHKMLVGHRQSAQIMSRSSQLDRKMISELRELLSTFDLNEHYLTIVKQSNCEFESGKDKPFISVNGNVDCDKPGHRVDRPGFHLRIGPFQFSAHLPF